jgi:hypothetical protein
MKSKENIHPRLYELVVSFLRKAACQGVDEGYELVRSFDGIQ